MNFTISEENYLKAIFHLQAEVGVVSTSTLAKNLKTSSASVTEMMKKLSLKNLLHYKPYYGFTLSAEGKKVALFIVRRHRLWEYFLSEKLKFDWSEIHLIAEELEHISSKKLIDRLEAFLEFPQYDPHGDPIPDKKGKIKNIHKTCLIHLPVNQPAEVMQVTHQTLDMLELLEHKQIAIGSRIEVKRIFEFDQSLELKIKKTTLTLSHLLAKNIYVKYEQNI
ncbi:MAG: metal-dependent transcriptional regulator [Flavisolibacter sp.]